MTIRDALQTYADIEADLLLAHTMRVDKEYLYTHSSVELTNSDERSFVAIATKRRSGMPIAYILGHKYFYGHTFTVNQHVLIPRPESEWLVERALEIKKSLHLKILDVGTGSGCLLISAGLALTDQKPELVGVDISADALAVAKHNAQTLNIDATFIESDLFENVNGTFDIIFANLPYVPFSDYANLQEHLKFEPADAITTYNESWEIYDRFLEQLPQYIREGSMVLLEIDPKQKLSLENAIKKWIPHANVMFAKDIHDLWRYCQIIFSNR